MRKRFCLVFGTALTLAVLAQAAQEKPKESQDKAKAPAARTLKVKLNYTGSGTVDDKHRILVFLFDSPDFTQGGVMPIGSKPASAKDEVVTFSELSAPKVYAVACYDPKGGYDGMSGPPPSGSSMGMYTKGGGPEPIELEEGKTTQVDLAFDDSFKMP